MSYHKRKINYIVCHRRSTIWIYNFINIYEAGIYQEILGNNNTFIYVIIHYYSFVIVGRCAISELVVVALSAMIESMSSG
jgi:hypothetical protein